VKDYVVKYLAKFGSQKFTTVFQVLLVLNFMECDTEAVLKCIKITSVFSCCFHPAFLTDLTTTVSVHFNLINNGVSVRLIV